MASGQPSYPKMAEKLVAECDQLWWGKEFRVARFGFSPAIPLPQLSPAPGLWYPRASIGIWHHAGVYSCPSRRATVHPIRSQPLTHRQRV